MEDSRRKQLIANNLNTLDYLKGTGIISTHKRKLANECYLFISSGGNGHKMLTTLRRQLEWQVDPLELERKVGFLAIDACHQEMEDLVTELDFERTEVLKLPYEGAHDSIAPNKITPQMNQWVYPDLYAKTGGMAATAPSQSGFDPSGAGAWRQPGRIRLCQPNSLTSLKGALTTAVRNLAVNKSPGARFHVFFLAGLAGGTGSGTIVDLAFLTRHIIKHEVNADLYTKTQVSAYLLLPSACGTDSNAQGDRNAYAALKEIDYFMGLQARGESFRQLYGSGFDVEITENIFDFCTLVEGIADGGVFYEDTADTARHVTANSILNLIAVPDGDPGKARPFLAEAFLSNKTQKISEAIIDQTHRAWPRNANYVYNVIGYSCCVVPIDLITVYVANIVFEEVWKKFDRYREATEEAAENFLQDCLLEPKELYKETKAKLVLERIDDQADECFQKKGPYYMINLLNKACRLIVSEDYRGCAARKSGGIFGKKNKSWERTEGFYRMARDHMRDMNHQLFEVYTEVIDQLKQLLRENAGLLTETKKYEDTFGSSFHWSPINLTNGMEATRVIKTYLDELIPKDEVHRKAQRFVNEMCDMKDAWTKLEPSIEGHSAAFDVAGCIRKFVEKEFKECVNTTMEAFLVKLYSGDPNARVPELDANEDPQGHRGVKTAAAGIVSDLQRKASALVQTSQHFYLKQCANHVYITVPGGCKWLPDAIADCAASNSVTGRDNIYCSSAQNEIVLYQIYAGVPAWALNWVEQAEEKYRDAPQSCGLHIEKSRDGWSWDQFPDLSFEYAATEKDRQRRKDEQKLADMAAEDLAKARDLGLLIRIPQPGVEVEQYDLFLLKNPQAAVDGMMAQAGLDPRETYSREDLYSRLAEKGTMRTVPLRYANAEFNTQERPAPEDLGWELTYKSLRHMMAVWSALRDGFVTLEKLTDALKEHNTTADRLRREEERKMVFLASLASGALRYNAVRKRWYACAEDEFPLGGVLEKPQEWACKEYYAAQAFYDLDEDLYRPFAQAKQELEDQGTDEQLKEIAKQRKALRDFYITLRRQTKPSGEPDVRFPMAADQFRNVVGEELCQKIRAFYDWMIDFM